jgi:hypothetical protein
MKTYSSIRNDFQYFVRSIKGHLIFYNFYRINKEAKMRTYSSIRMTFNILWDPQQGNSYLFPVPLRIMTLSWRLFS